ncbi:phosphoribosylanthranilate isomerase [Gorillibacterium massiliense]|uniref:phosphoribosylanthranilate isomerase n=1 Tax=Gorillibacterium massiliense TaxID=1280390 RepID=UPI0004B1EAB5|nr:phosphoribosylanthranilate isomerase [Gorillibacterium massiliense]
MSGAETNQRTAGKTLIKICGITDVETLTAIRRMPIDYIGFVFANSRRKVTPVQTAEFIKLLKEAREYEAAGIAGGREIPQTVGVFVEPSREMLTDVLSVAPLDVVQLHSSEPPEFCNWIKETFAVKVFRVLSFTETAAENSSGEEEVEAAYARLAPYQGSVDAFLLDTFDPVYGGGSGKTFPWEAIPAYREAARMLNLKLIVAGGLHSDNVGTLVRTYFPDGVDVSSGVETNGKKDIAKIAAFVERVRSCDQPSA